MNNKTATLVDFVTDYIDSTFSVRPDMLDTVPIKVRLAVIELQKKNMLPETTIVFTSEDMKNAKYDNADRLIYEYYELPEDFRQLYNGGPAFEVSGKKKYSYTDYSNYLRVMNSTNNQLFTLHKINDKYGKRHRLIATPFPDDDDEISISYYIDGVNTEMRDINANYYMPIINHVSSQMGLKSNREYQDNVNELKRDRNDPAGQGSHHNSFTTTKPRFFGKHR